MDKWDERFLELTKLVASWSKDNSTKVGAVIVDNKNRIVSLGYNGLPRGINREEFFTASRTKKLRSFIHAEENAILFARGNTEGHSIYIWPFLSCAKCSSLIIQAGIKRIVTPDATGPERWAEEFITSKELLKEAGVAVLAV